MPEVKEQCVWTLDDESWLIQYITMHRAKGGEGLNFDKTFWITVASAMAKNSKQGPAKTSEACQSKWARVSTVSIPISGVLNDEPSDPFNFQHRRQISQLFWHGVQPRAWRQHHRCI